MLSQSFSPNFKQ